MSVTSELEGKSQSLCVARPAYSVMSLCVARPAYSVMSLCVARPTYSVMVWRVEGKSLSLYLGQLIRHGMAHVA